jgi:membrane associated rhomboid family serine protease
VDTTAAPRQPIFNIPMIILALVAAMGLIHTVMTLVPTPDANRILLLFAFLPERYALPGDSLPGGWGADIWTFVTYAFFHSNLNHLLFNLLWLVAFGVPVARRFGALRFLAFFLATAAAGAATHLAAHFDEPDIVIGASAAVSGAMAAAMRFAFQRGGPLTIFGLGQDSAYRVPAASLLSVFRDPRLIAILAVWFGTNLLFGLVALPGVEGRVAWEAHVGGFLAGLIGFALFDPVRPSPSLDGDGEPDDDANVH